MAQSFDSWSSGGYDWGNSGFGDNTQYRQDDQGSEHYGGYNIENTQSYNYFEPEQHYVDNNKQNQGFMNPQSNFYNNQYYTPAEDPNSLYGQMAMSSSSSLSTGRKSVLSNSAFSPNNFDEDEPPLLEELGINFSHIQQKTLAVLHPTKAADPAACQDNDLAGPLVFALAFGATLLLAGKIHFNYIYGIGVMGSLGMYMLLNLMSVDGCGFLGVVSVLGYCLLPMVGLSSVAVFISLKGSFGLIMSILCVGWASLASSKLFVSALTMNGQQMLVAYPCALVYGVFALLTVF
ncbi:protein YIPF5-like [Symsagittifera roscoffensis]|uniref:protein YIPF5-like n=1 Tax=Symsagittifera roscoffensis TaxID=84072 RepID=UPI00307B9793